MEEDLLPPPPRRVNNGSDEVLPQPPIKKKTPYTTGIKSGTGSSTSNTGRDWGNIQQQPFDFSQQQFTPETPALAPEFKPSLGRARTSAAPQLGNTGGFMQDIQQNVTGERYSPNQEAMSAKLNKINQTYDTAQGEGSTAKAQAATGTQGDITTGIPTEERKGNHAKYIYNSFLNGIGSLVNSVGDIGATVMANSPNVGYSYNGENIPAERTPEQIQQQKQALVDYRKEIAPMVRGYFEENLGADVDEGVRAKYDNEFLASSIGGLANSVPAMLLPAPIRTAGFILQGYDFGLKNLEQNDPNGEIDDLTKTIYAASIGTASGLLEKLGFEKLFGAATPSVATTLTNKALREVYEATNGKVTGDALTKFLNTNIKDLAERYAARGVRGVEGFLIEAGTGGAQEVANVASEYLLNSATGKPVFDTEDASLDGMINNLKRIAYSAAQEGVGGGLIRGILNPKQRASVQAQEESIQSINDELENPELSEPAKEVLLQRKVAMQLQLDNEIAVADQEFGKLNQKQKEQVASLSEDLDKVTQALADPNISDDIKPELEKQAEEITNSIDEVRAEKPTSEKVPVKKGTDVKIGDEVEFIDGKTGTVTNIEGENITFDLANGAKFMSNPSFTEMFVNAPSVSEEIVTPVKENVNEETTVTTPSVTEQATVEEVTQAPEEVSTAAVEETLAPPKQYGYEDIDAMTNEKEVADNLYEEITSPTELSPVEQAIRESGGFYTTPDSYARFGDKNNQNDQMAKSYFNNKKGIPLDKIAESLSKEGLEVTPEDLKDYMEKFPDGNTTYSGRAKALQTKLFDMTGKKYNKFTVQKFRERLANDAMAKMKAKPDVVTQDAIDLINEEGITAENLDTFQDQIEFILGNDTFQTIKKYLDGTKTKTTDNGPAIETSGKTTEDSGTSPRVAEPAAGTETTAAKEQVKKIGDPVRAFAEKVRSGKISKLGGFNAGTGFDVAWDLGLETVATALDAGAKVADAIQSGLKAIKDTDWYKGLPNKDDFDQQYTDHMNNEYGQENVDTVVESEVSGIKKALVSDEIIRDVDLNRISDEEMQAMGKKLVETGEVNPKDIVNEIGRDGNHRALQPKEVVSLIYYKATLDNGRRSLLEERNKLAEAGMSTAAVDSKLNTLQAEINLFDVTAVITAQQQSMAFRLRRGLLDKDYNLITQIEQYKKVNGGVIEPEVEARFRELDKELTRIKAELAKAEQRALDAEEKQSVENIKEDVARSSKKNRSSLTPAEQARKKQLASKYRVFNDVTRIVTILAEKDFQEYAKLVLKEAKGDFQTFAVDMLGSVGVDIKNFLPKLYNDIGGAGSTAINLDDLIEKPYVKDGELIIPQDYIRNLVEDGVTDIDQLSQSVLDLVSADLPGATIRQVRDAITNYGKTVNMSKDETQRKINEAKRLGRLYSELEDLENDKRKAKNVNQQNKITQQEKELKSKIKVLEQALPKTPEEIEATEEQRLERRKESLKRYIQEKQKRLDEGNFNPRPRPNPINADAELLALQTEANKIRNEYDASHYENQMRNRPPAKKAYDTLIEWATGVTRALVAGLDFGAFGVQGAISILSNNPNKTWNSVKESLKFGLGTGVNPLKSLSNAKQFFRELGSENYEREFLAALRANPYYEVMKASGLAIQEPNARLGERDDALQASVINKIWNAAMYPLKFVNPVVYEKAKTLNPYRAGERAYTGAINSLRTTLFLEFAQDLEDQGMTFESDPKSYKVAANATNNLTLRGRLRNLESIAPELATVFFAPRKVAAALSLTNPAYWAHMWATEPVVAKRALLKMAKFMVIASTLTLTAKAFKDDEDEDSNPDVFNPLSPDFMKMRFGNTRMDLFGGLGQNVVLFARMLTGKYKSSTSSKVSKLGEGTFVPKAGELLGRFASNKFAPTTQLIYKKLMEGRGSEVEWEDEAVTSTTPIWAQSIKELSKEHPVEMATLFTFLSFIGGNISTYGTADFVDPNKEGKLLELIKSKNASFTMKSRPNIDIIDVETGDLREMTKDEYKEYKKTYGEYVKKDLKANYDEYNNMSMEEFENKLTGIKSKANKIAKEGISGVTPEMLSIESGGVKYELTPDQIKMRMQIIKEESELDKDVLEDYILMNKEQGMNPEKAKIEAEKKFKSLMNTRSKNRLLEMFNDGEIKLSVKED